MKLQNREETKDVLNFPQKKASVQFQKIGIEKGIKMELIPLGVELELELIPTR